MTTELVPKTITPAEIFVPKGLDPILTGVRIKVEEFDVPSLDMEKSKDRDSLRTFSADIGRSRKYIDDSRILYVKDKKAALKVIDQECKSFRDTMTEIQTTTRRPLTDWEEADKARIEAERQHEIYLMEWDEAISEHSIFTREKEIAAKEAEFAKIEVDKMAKEQAELAEKERLENEARIKKEAAEQAERDAADKIQAEKDAKEQAERDRARAEENAKLAAEKAERDAKEAARWAENDRIQAAEKAKADQAEAVQKAKDDAAKKTKRDAELEKIRLAGIKEEEERKASNKRHQASVNNKAKDGLMKTGITEKQATDIIIEIAQGRIPFLQINY